MHEAANKAVPGARITTLRPDAAARSTDNEPRVNIYLFQVRPNVGWREAEKPAAVRRANRGRQPKPVLDLLYLLTFFGDDARLEGQRILGRVLERLHRQPEASHDLLVQGAQSVRGRRRPLRLVTAEASQFAEVESVRFVPLQQDLDEMAKLWSVLSHTPYVMSVVFKGTVTLVDGQQSAALRAEP